MNEIIVKEYELPKLEIKNYKKIVKAVELDNAKYKGYLVTEDTLDTDIKKRAELRNNAKSINQRRLDIEKKISEPIKDFKAKCDTLVKMYETSADLIDTQIKFFEDRTKEAKKQLCNKIFNDYINELKGIVAFDSIFDEKWLNKGSGIMEVEKEIRCKIIKINDELKAIENLKSEYEVELKNDYLMNFDLGKVIIKNNTLISSKELLVKASANKEIRETEELKAKVEEIVTTKVEIPKGDIIKTYSLEITGTIAQFEKLREFLQLNKMTFKKIDKEVK